VAPKINLGLQNSREGYQPEIMCVEPYPNDFLKEQSKQGIIELIDSPVEELTVDLVSTLQEGDLFFVDSTHTLGPAGESSRIILELLPRLNKGVYIHFHDIWFPFDYKDSTLKHPSSFGMNQFYCRHS
jgi:hypothetical protein